MKTWCLYCDPKYYMIFGFCGNCGRRCEPPLYNPKGQETLQEYDKRRSEWNKERGDLMLDAMRSREK